MMLSAQGIKFCMVCRESLPYARPDAMYCGRKCLQIMRHIRNYKNKQNVCFCGKIIYGRKHCSKWHGVLWRTYGKEM